MTKVCSYRRQNHSVHTLNCSKPIKIQKIELFFWRFLQNASYGQEMTPERSWSVLWTQNTLFPPTNTTTNVQERFFQNRFWPLEKLFLLIGAWGSSKNSHFRGLYSELFRPNGGVLDCFLADWNSLRVYLKLVTATFSIYFVIFEKKFSKNFGIPSIYSKLQGNSLGPLR